MRCRQREPKGRRCHRRRGRRCLCASAFSHRGCVIAYGRAVARGDGRVGTGPRVELAVCRGGGADTLGRTFCPEALAWEVLASEALAMTRAIWSWLALSCSTALALSRAICSCLVLSSSIPCS